LQGLQGLGENGFDTTAEGQRLRGVGLREEQGKLVTADAKGGVGGTQGFLQRGRRRAKNLVAARMAVALVDIFDAVQVENDNAKRKVVTTRAIHFLLERFGEQATVVEAGQGVRNSVDLELFVVFVLENHGDLDQSGGCEHLNQNGFEGDRAAEALG